MDVKIALKAKLLGFLKPAKENLAKGRIGLEKRTTQRLPYFIKLVS